MIDLIDQLRQHNLILNDILGRSVTLSSLHASYRQFVMYFNMNMTICTYQELHRMLLTEEEDLKKGIPTRPPKSTSLSVLPNDGPRERRRKESRRRLLVLNRRQR